MKHKQVIVIGAGMAGLSAAYELSKHPEFKVTVLEARNRVGGRVYAKTINGYPVDFGGFLVYRWYKQYHRLLQELNMESLLEPVPIEELYYELDDTGKLYFGKDMPEPTTDYAKLTVAMAKPIMMASDPANPPLDGFDRTTASEFYRKVLKRPEHAGYYEQFTDTFMQGFCYPAVTEMKLAFMAPFIYTSQFYGGIEKQQFIRSGNDQVPAALAQVIKAAGNVIHCGAQVTSINQHTVQTSSGEYKADYIVFAQNVTPELFQQVLPKVPTECTYTHFYTATLKADTTPVVNNNARWGAVFYKPNHEQYQVTSAVNLATVYHPNLRGYINLNVVVRNLPNATALSTTELFTLLEPQLQKLFPTLQLHEFVDLQHWPKTMPLAQESFVEGVRAAQGKHGYYFAGDYLGAPSMETAVATGAKAAEAIIANQ